MNRLDGRQYDELRPCTFHADFLRYAKASVLMEQGNTRIVCAVSVTDSVPKWMKDQKVPGGWLTSEYQMLPASTGSRTTRDVTRGSVNGRAQEIQRLIGRSLRAVVDLKGIGQRTIYVDCDVLDADGGTRCASINGASLALRLALQRMVDAGILDAMPMMAWIGAVSVGVVGGHPVLDLCYQEDSAATVDMNVVMTNEGRFIEIQGTGEESTFSRDELTTMLDLATAGIARLVHMQQTALRQTLDTAER